MSTTPIIAFENVTKEYRLDEEHSIFPVKGLSLEIHPGELIVIIGRSGTGKTTMLNLAAGLVHPTEGRVFIQGKDLSGLSDKQVSRLRSHQLGFVFQFPSLLPPLTVLDNIMFPTTFLEDGKLNARERAIAILERLGLADKANVLPKQLSAGEQKRVVIARSLINNPALILADEPTSDLDAKTETEVMSIMRSINEEGVTFLIVTHSLDLMEFASRAFEMDHGVLNQVYSDR
jgi:ABC-type lipoprotein export system ATPase subunit